MPMTINPPRRLPSKQVPDVRPSPRAHRSNPDLPIAFHSMQGMGDNLHQRAIIRQLMLQNVVYLNTPWPSIYHDLVGPQLYLVRPVATTLRTQAKNVQREADKYQLGRHPGGTRVVHTWYSGEEVRRHGSIFAAMVRNAGCSMDGADFRLPVPTTWTAALANILPPTPKPIMLYRPLVLRTEWPGCAGRNPDAAAYRELFLAIRERFFVVSVADLKPGVEWLATMPVPSDLELHAGELTFELLAALAKRAALVFCSPGFAPLLAQAVGTPVVCVFGGHESSMTIKDGAQFAPTLGIDPITPCNCFDHTHAHRKAIDIPSALHRLQDFVQEIENAHAAYRGIAAAFARHRLAQADQTIHESGRVGDVDRASA